MKLKIQALIAAVLTSAGIAHAQPAQPVEKLPMVVITGKSVQAQTHVVQLPRVIVEGSSLNNQRLAVAKSALGI